MLYECVFDEEYPLHRHQGHEGGAPCLRYSHSARFLLTGGADGALRVMSTKAVGPYACVEAHDKARRGRMATRAAALSYDDRFLLSCGADGGLFVFRLKPEELEEAAAAAQAAKEALSLKQAAAAEPLRAVADSDVAFDRVMSSQAGDLHDDAAEDAMEEPEDITAGDHYSIQEDKLKREEDNRIRAAEKKKDGVREVINELRRDFRTLLAVNAADTPEQRLDREEFDIDPQLRESLVAEGRHRCEEVAKTHEWETLRTELQLKKLRDRFLEQVDVEGMELRSFKTGLGVSSFRTVQLSEALEESLKGVHAMIEADEETRRRTEHDAGGKGGGKGGKGGLLCMAPSVLLIDAS